MVIRKIKIFRLTNECFFTIFLGNKCYITKNKRICRSISINNLNNQRVYELKSHYVKSKLKIFI